MSIAQHLRELGACASAVDWVGDRDPATAWAECPRGDWLLWVAGRLGADRRTLVLAACACARDALRFVPSGETRPLAAIETAERWVRGEASIRDVRAAAAAAADARAAASSAAAAWAADAADAARAADAAASSAAAAWAAAAAAWAADAAAWASSAAAAWAADAAVADAAAAADAADADAAARAAAFAAVFAAAHQRLADLVRGIVPMPTIEVPR